MKLRIKTFLLSIFVVICTSVAPAQVNMRSDADGPSNVKANYDREQIEVLIASVMSGTGKMNLTDQIFDDRPLFNPGSGAHMPRLIASTLVTLDTGRMLGISNLAAPQETTLSKLPDKNRGQVYENGLTTTRANLGVFNVKDFRAKDDDATDNARSIQDAIDAAAAEGGGVVRLSYGTSGVYRINAPLVYKQGVIIEGETSALGAKVKLKLMANNSNAITIGGNLMSVQLRNMELYTTPSNANTKGILFTGSGANATQMVTLEGLTINGFTRGISVEATDSAKAWQMSYVTARNIVIHDSLYGVYIDAINSDWNFDNLLTYIRRDGFAVYVVNAGTLQLNHPNFLVSSVGGPCVNGVPNPGFGSAAIQIEGHHGAVTVINAQQEGFRKTLVQNREDWTYPIVFMNTVMAAPIDLNADTVFVSIGNFYYDDTVKAKGDTRIYSMGDSISTGTSCLGPGKGVGGFVLSEGAFIVKRESIYGTDYQMPVSINAAAPNAQTGNPNNPAIPLFSIGAPTATHVFMRLGQTDQVTRVFKPFYYDISRDNDGLLNIFGSQPMPYRGVKTNGIFKALHFGGAGSAPTVATGSAGVVGNGASATVAGTDAALEVTLRTGSGARAAGTLFTVTFSTPYDSAPFEVFSPSSPDSAALVAAGVGVYSTSTTTTMLLASTGGIGDSKTLKFKIQVKQ